MLIFAFAHTWVACPCLFFSPFEAFPFSYSGAMTHRRVIILDSFSDDDSDGNVLEPPSFVSSFSNVCSQVATSVPKKRAAASEDDNEEDSIAKSSEPEEATTNAPSACKKHKAVDREQEQYGMVFPHRNEQEILSLQEKASKQREQENSPSSEVAPKGAKIPVRDKEQEEDSLSHKNEKETYSSEARRSLLQACSLLVAKKSSTLSRDEKQQEDSWSQPCEQVHSPASEVATTTKVLDDKESNTPSHSEKQQKDSWAQPSEQYLSSSAVLATTSANLLPEERFKSNTPSRGKGQEEDSWSETIEQLHSPSSEAAATSVDTTELLAAVKLNTSSRDEEQETSSKRTPTANSHSEGSDIEGEEDQQEPNSSLDGMSQPTFPEVVHKMVTETAATQPHVIDWVHYGTAFVVHDPVRNKTLLWIVFH